MSTERTLPSQSQDKLISGLLSEGDVFDNKINCKILIRNVQIIKDSLRFDNSLTWILSTLLDFVNPNILTSLFLEFK